MYWSKLPVYRYVNSRPAQWPEAEFVVGNPPFIGGKDLRAELGDGYEPILKDFGMIKIADAVLTASGSGISSPVIG
jgi:hypothetical protein